MWLTEQMGGEERRLLVRSCHSPCKIRTTRTKKAAKNTGPTHLAHTINFFLLVADKYESLVFGILAVTNCALSTFLVRLRRGVCSLKGREFRKNIVDASNVWEGFHIYTKAVCVVNLWYQTQISESNFVTHAVFPGCLLQGRFQCCYESTP